MEAQAPMVEALPTRGFPFPLFMKRRYLPPPRRTGLHSPKRPHERNSSPTTWRQPSNPAEAPRSPRYIVHHAEVWNLPGSGLERERERAQGSKHVLALINEHVRWPLSEHLPSVIGTRRITSKTVCWQIGWVERGDLRVVERKR